MRAVADEARGGKFRKGLQGLRHGSVIGECFAKFKTIHHRGTRSEVTTENTDRTE